MRLKDADALLDYFGVTELCKDCCNFYLPSECQAKNYSLQDICNAVYEMPTIQAITEETSDKIVRCKDCKYFEERDYEVCDADGRCLHWNFHATKKDGFCFKGKVKTIEVEE